MIQGNSRLQLFRNTTVFIPFIFVNCIGPKIHSDSWIYVKLIQHGVTWMQDTSSTTWCSFQRHPQTSTTAFCHSVTWYRLLTSRYVMIMGRSFIGAQQGAGTEELTPCSLCCKKACIVVFIQSEYWEDGHKALQWYMRTVLGKMIKLPPKSVEKSMAKGRLWQKSGCVVLTERSPVVQKKR